jgi:hypothetical protein
MAADQVVQVVGAEQVAADLGRLADDLEDLAPPAVGAYVRDQARAAAPFVTGALRASLHAETGDGRVTVSSGLVYAGVIHNGWADHGITANPFLVPVAEQTEPMWGRIYLAEVKQAAAHVKGA